MQLQIEIENFLHKFVIKVTAIDKNLLNRDPNENKKTVGRGFN